MKSKAFTQRKRMCVCVCWITVHTVSDHFPDIVKIALICCMNFITHRDKVLTTL